MTSKEIVIATIEQAGPERLGCRLAPGYWNDFVWIGMSPNVDDRPLGLGRHRDEWGTVWNNIGVSRMGEAVEFPLDDWDALETMAIPDVNAPARWSAAETAIRAVDPGKFILGCGISIYERIHFLRGLENTWTDIHLEPERLRRLIALLVRMNCDNILHLKRLGADGYIFCDDWGLQDRLMIAPEQWREFWFPAYAEIYRAAHAAGMKTLLHSCGYILDILPGLIEAGLDVILMDQQQNMGLEALGRFAGKITFCCPVDIQAVMPAGDLPAIRACCRRLAAHLSTAGGGFIPDWYADPAGAGHSEPAVAAMCEEFHRVARQWRE